MEDSALSRAVASSKETDYSSCEGVSEIEEAASSFHLCLIPPIADRVARRHNLSRVHLFNVFRKRPSLTEFDASEGVSTFETALNLFNMTVGSGVFVLPYAAQTGGWIVLIILAVYAIWSGASYWMIGAALAEVDQEGVRRGISREGRGWNLLAEVAMGKTGRKTIEALLYAECLSIQITYLILAGTCLHIMVPSISTGIHVFCIGAMVGPLLFVPLQYFAVFSFVGFTSYCMICVAITATGIELGGWEHIHNQERFFVIPSHLFAALGVVTFVYNGQCGSPAFYQTMKDRSSWATAVAWAMVGVCCFSIALAAAPYGIFGTAAKQSIIENVGKGMDGKILEEPFSKSFNISMSQSCAFFVALKQIVSFPSYALPVVSALEDALDVQEQSSLQLVTRMLYALITGAFAAAMSGHLALVMSVAGCVTNILFSNLLPALLYALIRWDRLDNLSRGVLLALVLVSIVQMVGGVCSAFHEMLSQT